MNRTIAEAFGQLVEPITNDHDIGIDDSAGEFEAVARDTQPDGLDLAGGLLDYHIQDFDWEGSGERDLPISDCSDVKGRGVPFPRPEASFTHKIGFLGLDHIALVQGRVECVVDVRVQVMVNTRRRQGGIDGVSRRRDRPVVGRSW